MGLILVYLSIRARGLCVVFWITHIMGALNLSKKQNRSQCFKDYSLAMVPHAFFCLAASKTVGRKTVAIKLYTYYIFLVRGLSLMVINYFSLRMMRNTVGNQKPDIWKPESLENRTFLEWRHSENNHLKNGPFVNQSTLNQSKPDMSGFRIYTVRHKTSEGEEKVHKVS